MTDEWTVLLTRVLQVPEDFECFEQLVVRLAVCNAEEAQHLADCLLEQLQDSHTIVRGLEVVDAGLETLNFAFLHAVEGVLTALIEVCAACTVTKEEVLRKSQLWALKYGLISDRLTAFHTAYIRLVQEGEVFPEQALEAGLKHIKSILDVRSAIYQNKAHLVDKLYQTMLSHKEQFELEADDCDKTHVLEQFHEAIRLYKCYGLCEPSVARVSLASNQVPEDPAPVAIHLHAEHSMLADDSDISAMMEPANDIERLTDQFRSLVREHEEVKALNATLEVALMECGQTIDSLMIDRRDKQMLFQKVQELTKANGILRTKNTQLEENTEDTVNAHLSTVKNLQRQITSLSDANAGLEAEVQRLTKANRRLKRCPRYVSLAGLPAKRLDSAEDLDVLNMREWAACLSQESNIVFANDRVKVTVTSIEQRKSTWRLNLFLLNVSEHVLHSVSTTVGCEHPAIQANINYEQEEEPLNPGVGIVRVIEVKFLECTSASPFLCISYNGVMLRLLLPAAFPLSFTAGQLEAAEASVTLTLEQDKENAVRVEKLVQKLNCYNVFAPLQKSSSKFTLVCSQASIGICCAGEATTLTVKAVSEKHATVLKRLLQQILDSGKF